MVVMIAAGRAPSRPRDARAPSPAMRERDLPRAKLPLPHSGGGLGRGHDRPAKTQSLKAETP
jgi:hypothetical protein